MSRAGLSHLSWLPGLKESQPKRSLWMLVIQAAATISPERETVLSQGVIICFIQGLFQFDLQHVTNTSISVVNTHANKVLFILTHFCTHIFQIWKIKADTKEGKCFIFQSGQDSISIFRLSFCLQLASIFPFHAVWCSYRTSSNGEGAICWVVIWWRRMSSWMCWRWNLNDSGPLPLVKLTRHSALHT